MKKTIISIAALIFITSASAQTALNKCNYSRQSLDSVTCEGPAYLQESSVKQNLQVTGPLETTRSSLDTVNVTGLTKMSETNVKGNMKIAGSLKAKESSFDQVQIAGNADLEMISIAGNAEIAGNLAAKKTRFSKDVSVSSEKVDLQETGIKGNLTIKSKKETPVLELACHSWIQGSVVFSGMPGVIKMTSDSKVSGKITNGKTETIEKSC